MASYNTSDLRKGLKVQIDGVPYQILECQFVKPGKGQALYRLKLLNLIRGTNLERTLKSGDSMDVADIREQEMQYLYRDGENYVFMDPGTFDQPAIPASVGDTRNGSRTGSCATS